MESANKDREKKRKMLEDLPQVRSNPYLFLDLVRFLSKMKIFYKKDLLTE
jgi:hypothetical protein